MPSSASSQIAMMGKPITRSARSGTTNYWAEPREANPAEGRLLQALADSVAVALQNIGLSCTASTLLPHDAVELPPYGWAD